MAREPKDRFYEINSYLAGLLTGAALLVTWQFSSFISVLREWQTLVAGVIATIAAVVTVHAIYLQIAQVDALAIEKSLRKNWSARALIAGPLSRLCAIGIDLRKKLFDEMGQCITGSRYNGNIEWQSLSEREIDLLAQCIRDADPRAAADISALLSELQIQEARLGSMVSEKRDRGLIVTVQNLRDLALDSIFIGARAQRLFHYSRRDDADYFAKPMSRPVKEQHWRELQEFQVDQEADRQLEKAKDKWLSPIQQRTPQGW